jgi:ribonuclease D
MITTPHELASVLPQLTASEIVAVDTEFMREKTYWPRLCLIQIAAGDEVVLIDPLPSRLDLRPLGELWETASILKVFHAGTQDIEMLYRVCGTAPAPIFDTQDGAELIGMPQQISYKALVQRLLDIELEKADSFTDWAQRPLSKDQLNYAAEDVSWLLRLYPVLREELTALGRESWLDEEFAKRVLPETLTVNLQEQFRRLKRVSSLQPRSLAIAREVAAWREEEAMRRDLPKRWLLSDEAVLEITRRAPRSVGELRNLRGVGKNLQRCFDAILASVERGRAVPREQWPRLAGRRRPEGNFSAAIELMAALVRKRAEEHKLSSGQLATRAMLEDFIREHDESAPLLQGWRRALIGEELLRLLKGKIGLSLRDGMLVITQTEEVNENR